MAGKGDGQIVEGVSSNAGDASAKLSQESNQIGMTGFFGGTARVGLTTLDGIRYLPLGAWHAAINDLEHPMQIVKTVAYSAGIAAAMKVLLPEAGPVGKVAGAIMGGMFLYSAAPAFLGAYKTGLNANTWSELNQSGKLWGDAGGQVAVNSGLGYVGYRIGAGVSGRILSGEKFDAFADWKQAKWDRATDFTKNVLGMDTTVPSVTGGINMRPNYRFAGDKAELLDTPQSPREATTTTPLDGDAPMNATVMLQSKATVLGMDRYIARMADGRAAALGDEGGAFEQKFGATQESLDAVTAFAKQHNLTIAESDLRSGRVFLTGKTADFQNAFGVELNQYATDVGTDSIGHEGNITLPKELAPHIRAVLGMNTQAVAKPSYMLQVLNDDGKLDGTKPGDAPEDAFVKKGGYLATDIAKAQNFPMGTGGEGQHGAFVSMDGGIDLADYNKFWAEHGLPDPKPLKIIEVGGAQNVWGKSNADVENALDGLQMQSIAPKAEISMILGKNNNQGLVDAFDRAIFPQNGEAQNSVVSASWGLAENQQTYQLVNALHITFKQAALRGVQVFSGSGDNGAKALQSTFQPEYPASDPGVTGVGGLKMILDDQDKPVWVKAWEENHGSTGGGVSKIFDLPLWQKVIGLWKNLDSGKAGRGVPDISTNGATATGYPVRVGGENLVIGGTSAGAPLYGGLMLNINAELAPLGIKPITPLNPWLYARATDSNIFHDVTTGGNYGYEAGKNWDPVTGLGWVDGTAMLAAMKANQTTNPMSLSHTLDMLPKGVNVGSDQQNVQK